MKNSILIILVGLLTINLLNAQDEKLLSKVEKTEINGITTYLLNGQKFNGFIYDNYSDNKLKTKFQVSNGVKEGFSETYYKNEHVLEELTYRNGINQRNKLIKGTHLFQVSSVDAIKDPV